MFKQEVFIGFQDFYWVWKSLGKIPKTDDLFQVSGKWLCDFWLWVGCANCIMVFLHAYILISIQV